MKKEEINKRIQERDDSWKNVDVPIMTEEEKILAEKKWEEVRESVMNSEWYKKYKGQNNKF